MAVPARPSSARKLRIVVPSADSREAGFAQARSRPQRPQAGRRRRGTVGQGACRAETVQNLGENKTRRRRGRGQPGFPPRQLLAIRRGRSTGSQIWTVSIECRSQRRMASRRVNPLLLSAPRCPPQSAETIDAPRLPGAHLPRGRAPARRVPQMASQCSWQPSSARPRPDPVPVG
jgi:hypothetical protein